MLKEITISNYALIDYLRVDLSQGFTTITGETGAGKSIIVDAINLLLGIRADRRLIKKGQNEASVSALFSVSQNHEVINILNKSRENARSVQEHISKELWLSVNTYYLHISKSSTCKKLKKSNPIIFSGLIFF